MTDKVNEETEFEEEFNKIADKTADIEPEIKDEPADIENNDGIPGDDPEPKDDIKPDEDQGMYAGLNDEAKAYWEGIEQQNEKLAHRINSDDGRVRAYQKQTQDLQDQVKSLAEQGDGPSKTDIVEAMKGGSETWTKFQEDYPEIAEVFDQRATETGVAIQEAVDQALAPIKEQQERITENEMVRADVEAAEPVTDEFPTWKEAVNTPDYLRWVSEQPPGIKALGDSAASEDAIALIGLYDSSQVASGKPSIRKTTPDNGVDTTADLDQQETEAEKLKAKRQRQLNDGATVEGKGANINPGNEAIEDFDKAFNFYANKKERQRA